MLVHYAGYAWQRLYCLEVSKHKTKACLHIKDAVVYMLHYLIGKINETTIVGGGCGLPKAHVDEISFVLQDRDQSPC
jgi:hypothetical protein